MVIFLSSHECGHERFVDRMFATRPVNRLFRTGLSGWGGNSPTPSVNKCAGHWTSITVVVCEVRGVFVLRLTVPCRRTSPTEAHPMRRRDDGRSAMVAGALMMIAVTACSSTNQSAVDAAPPPPDVAPEARPDVVDAIAEVAEVSLLGSTCVIPNPPASGLPNPAMYDTAITGTVFDRLAGLMWQRSASGSP